MAPQSFKANYDPHVKILDIASIKRLGHTGLLGNWFIFLTAEWTQRTATPSLQESSTSIEPPAHPTVAFRGKENLTLPAILITHKTLPKVNLVSLTCDKSLYRAHRDTVRLLIAAPQMPHQRLKLILQLNGATYANYPITLDEFGLYLWSMQDLPEGTYSATLAGSEAPIELSTESCCFEVAEYRLAPLNAEIADQQLGGTTLRYILSVTAFGQPYSGPTEVELQERGQRIGKRETLTCNREGQCRGVVQLTGQGPYSLNLFAGERTASVALKGSEQECRESIIISDLGEIRVASLMPLPQSNRCRGMYIARGGSNTEPFLVRRVIGKEVEITARVNAELLRVVVVNPVRGTFEEKHFKDLKADTSVQMPVSLPYGIVLLGAFVDGKAWEGWCTILCPEEIQLQCEAPKEARPGSRITVTLKTGMADRVVPVQLIVKDQRLTASSDPQVEFAACIKKNLTEWSEQSGTGEVDRTFIDLLPALQPRLGGPPQPFAAASGNATPTMFRPMSTSVSMVQPDSQSALLHSAPTGSGMPHQAYETAKSEGATPTGAILRATAPIPTTTVTLAKIRMQFPEILYNAIVKVQGQANVEVKLGDSLTSYTIEAFALSPETLDWQRVETTVTAVKSVYGELTVSPFVYPGDPVMGRLDVGAASGGAIADVRHDDEIVPLFYQNGETVIPGLPIPSGSVVYFPLRPGVVTSSVRDARKGGIDVSERYVTAPGRLRHIMRRLRLLTQGDEVTVRDQRDWLEIKPMPGLERPFQVFVEAATNYPFGCIEQTSTKLLAMFTGYMSNRGREEVARDYESAIFVWHKRLRSMYLPANGFSFYPPEEGGSRKPDTHYAPKGVKHLLSLPTARHAGIQSVALREILDDIQSMARDAATYYRIDYPPKTIDSCHAAYQILVSNSSPRDKSEAAAYVRAHLLTHSNDHHGQTYVEVPEDQSSYHLWGRAVSMREETAYAAAALFATGETIDIPIAIAATNYLTSQVNESGRLYSTIDTAACLALMIELQASGIVATHENGRIAINGQEMSLAEALQYEGKVESLRCIEGVVAAQITSEVIEDWGRFKNQIAVEVHLERDGRALERYTIGDALDLVIRVPHYEPGLVAHICLPDALARIVGGGQVKRFSLDFCEQNTHRIPLAAVSKTTLPSLKDQEMQQNLSHWLGNDGRTGTAATNTQHWAVIVRNMFKEEQVGNPGLLTVIVE